MGRRLALLLLLVGTFMTALIGSAFAKQDPIALAKLLGSSPSETFDIPTHLGGGFRECYFLRAPFNTVVSKVRRELVARGWQEIPIRTSPGHTLFADGIREVQVLEGKVKGAQSLTTAQTRLAARGLAWEPHQGWVSVVFDSPSSHPIDRTRGLLQDLKGSIS
jgi:hypothetical protein